MGDLADILMGGVAGYTVAKGGKSKTLDKAVGETMVFGVKAWTAVTIFGYLVILAFLGIFAYVLITGKMSPPPNGSRSPAPTPSNLNQLGSVKSTGARKPPLPPPLSTHAPLITDDFIVT